MRAIFRNAHMAIEIEVSEFVTRDIFAGVNPEVLYDIRRPLKREGRRLWFDKFRPGKEFWGMKSTPAQGTETELTVQLNGGSIDTDAIGSRSQHKPGRRPGLGFQLNPKLTI